jgi:hypothetical protein
MCTEATDFHLTRLGPAQQLTRLAQDISVQKLCPHGLNSYFEQILNSAVLSVS